MVVGKILSKMDKRIREQGSRFQIRPYEREAEWVRDHFDLAVDNYAMALRNETYEFGKMTTAYVMESKRRKIDYPAHLADRVYEQAFVNVAGPLMISKMTADTYSGIKDRGTLRLVVKMERAVRKHPGWVKIQTDFEHFYQNINHDLLKRLIRNVFKDKKAIEFIDRIIDKFFPGLAIGRLISAYLANLFLSPLDHQLKEVEHVPFLFRYMDDIVCIVPTIQEARKVLKAIKAFADKNGLTIKRNARISYIEEGIDLCGYVFYPDCTRLRKSIKENMKRSIRKWWNADDATFKRKLASHFGWCKHADCRHLVRTAFGEKYYIFAKNMEYKKLADIRRHELWFGLPKTSRISIRALEDKEIIFFEYKRVTVKGEEKVAVRFAFPDNEQEMHLFLTRSAVVLDRLEKAVDNLPFIATIKHDKNYYYFE